MINVNVVASRSLSVVKSEVSEVALLLGKLRTHGVGTLYAGCERNPQFGLRATEACVCSLVLAQHDTRGSAESYAARNRDLFDRDRAADDARIRAAVERVMLGPSRCLLTLGLEGDEHGLTPLATLLMVTQRLTAQHDVLNEAAQPMKR